MTRPAGLQLVLALAWAVAAQVTCQVADILGCYVDNGDNGQQAQCLLGPRRLIHAVV